MKKCTHKEVLASIDILRLANKDIQLGSIIAFLQVCKNEGLNIKELAYRCGFSVASASRFIHALGLPSARGNAIAHHGLVHVTQHRDDGRQRSVYLTKDGCKLRDEIDAILTSPAREER